MASVIFTLSFLRCLPCLLRSSPSSGTRLFWYLKNVLRQSFTFKLLTLMDLASLLVDTLDIFSFHLVLGHFFSVEFDVAHGLLNEICWSVNPITKFRPHNGCPFARKKRLTAHGSKSGSTDSSSSGRSASRDFRVMPPSSSCESTSSWNLHLFRARLMVHTTPHREMM